MAGKRWTEEEIDYLYESWGVLSEKEILKQLRIKFGRNIKRHGLECKLLDLGICSATSNGNWISTGQMAEILGMKRRTIYSWFIKGWIDKPKRILRKRKMYLMRLDEFVEWLKNNPGRWDASKVELYALGEEPQWLKEKRKIDAKSFMLARNYPKSVKRKLIIDKQTILQIKSKHEQGESYEKLAKQYFVSSSTIHRYVKKYNISA